MTRAKLNTFMQRLDKIGIEVDLLANYPWVYLHKVNGNVVEEKFMSNHGFTLAFITRDGLFSFTDTRKIFDTIRKYR